MLTLLALLVFLFPWAYAAYLILKEENRTSRRRIVYAAALANLTIVVAYAGFIVGFWFGLHSVKY